MKFEQFNTLTREQISDLVKESGPLVGVFALNGTRRWFQLEYGQHGRAVDHAYFDAITTQLIALSAMMFDYGVDSLLIPLLSPHLFDTRGSEYTQQTIGALRYLTRARKFLDFYQEQDVAARFYGDYGPYLRESNQHSLLEEIEQFNRSSPEVTMHRIFWGVCAHDSVTTTARLAIELYEETGCVPDKAALVKRYYGVELPEVSFFIGASKPRAFDTPLLLSGREDLYFTVAPSPYLNEQQFREILYDHLFARTKAHSNYKEMTLDDWQRLKVYYQQNAQRTLGVGERRFDWGIWLPTDQLEPTRNTLKG